MKLNTTISYFLRYELVLDSRLSNFYYIDHASINFKTY